MNRARTANTTALSVAALGVVFGDIGTSPLYAMTSCFQFGNATPKSLSDILGICSLLVWALVVVVCIKYIAFIMKVDHEGEGGILALLARAAKPGHGPLVTVGALTTVVVIGAAMLFGDGIITPAISVISAIEGVGGVSNSLKAWIVPISVVVLVALFAVQARGTEKVGKLFGPAMIVWFVSMGIAGAVAIVAHPIVLLALNPLNGIYFAMHHGIGGYLVLGGVVLAVTGVEALYADLSHFGRAPIVRAWFALVFPSLVLAYLGEGGALLSSPANLTTPLYALTPGIALVPMVVLATIATVIASQALISGAFTLVEQAIALGLCPRMEVLHTSRRIHGQVYVPAVAVALLISCVALVLTFRSSDRLAAAYGLAVATTMLATSLAYYVVITRVLKWNRGASTALVAFFVLIDGTFVLTGLPKFLDGAWLPLAISAVLTTVALTWLKGRRLLGAAISREQVPLEKALPLFLSPSSNAQGTMVLLSHDPNSVPFLENHKWLCERACEENVILMNLVPTAKPYLAPENRVTIEELAPRLTRVKARFGYMEAPRIQSVIHACQKHGLDLNDPEISFFLADPKIRRSAHDGMPKWQRWLFTALYRNARSLPEDLEIRPERQVELGITVSI